MKLLTTGTRSNSILPHHSTPYDYFFSAKMVFLPIVALAAYIFDAYYFMYHAIHHTNPGRFEGLLSTILIIFAYIQYCVPIKTKWFLFLYYIFLWVLTIAGHVGYLVAFIYLNQHVGIGVYVAWIVGSTIYTAGLIYYRVFRGRYHHIQVQNKHIFHFISQLEIILAIFIPIYAHTEFETLSRDSIAFFLLFDFFSDDYDRFHGVVIKSVLHAFVAVVTVTVVFEFIYFSLHDYGYEYTADIAEVVASYLFYLFVFLQFCDSHFKQEPVPKPRSNPHRNTKVETVEKKARFYGARQ